MDAQPLVRVCDDLVLAGGCISTGPLLKDVTPLTAAERVSAGTIGLELKHELESGRAYAKHALAMLGFYDFEFFISAIMPPWDRKRICSGQSLFGAKAVIAAGTTALCGVLAVSIAVGASAFVGPRLGHDGDAV
jgi:hypothetical protein